MCICPNCDNVMNTTEIAPVAVMVGALYGDGDDYFAEQVSYVQVMMCDSCGYTEGR